MEGSKRSVDASVMAECPSTCRPQGHAQCVVEFTDRRHYPIDENLTIGFNGFAKMSLYENRATIHYVDVRGATIFSESWVCEDGWLQRVKEAE